jgi:hypothetical protein
VESCGIIGDSNENTASRRSLLDISNNRRLLAFYRLFVLASYRNGTENLVDSVQIQRAKRKLIEIPPSVVQLSLELLSNLTASLQLSREIRR